MTPYAERNSTTVAINFRLKKELAYRWDAVVAKTGISKGQIYMRLIAAYLDGRIGTPQVDLPMPPPLTEEDILMAAAKKKVAVKAKVVKAAKTAAPKKK